MQYLKQSTAVTLKIGPFLDDTDGKTAETGLTIAQADVRLSKNGANIAQKTEATSCTHDELGIYGCPVDATDTATLGRLQLWVHESGALPVWHEYTVLPANVYDSMFSTDKLEVDLLQMGGVAQSATDLKDFADTGYDPSAHRTQALIKATDDIDLSATQKTSVNTEVDSALSDIHLDHLLAVDTGAALPGVAGSVWHDLLEDDGGTWRYTVNALEQAPSAGTNPNVLVNTTIASVTSQTVIVLTAGSNDDDAYKDQAIVIYDASDSDYPSVRKCSGYVGGTKTATLDSAPDFTMVAGDGVKVFVTAPGTTAPTAAQNATAIWEKDISAFAGAGYAGTYLKTVYDDWLNGGRLDLILDAIKTETDTHPTLAEIEASSVLALKSQLITQGSNDFNATAKASINTEVDTGLSDIKLDHLVAVADSDDPVNDSIIAKLAASDGDWSGFDKATDALEALRDRGDAAWTTGAGGSDRLLMVDTTIATLASQTSFTLTAGSADDDAYNNCTIVIEDASTATQKAVGIILNYAGGTKTVTLKYDPGIFTIATTDKVYILAENALKATLANRQLNVAADGDIAGNVDGSVASVVGAVGSVTADVSITQAAADKVWGTAARALTDKAGFALSTAGINAIADQVWDEVLTGATHNIADSAGKRLRQIAAYAIDSGTAQAGSSISITLAAGASSDDGVFNRNLIVIVGGTGAGQTRTITDYDGSTKIGIIDREWRVTPDATSEYQILADDTPLVVDHGVAQAGSSTTITLRDYASSIDDTYLCNIIAIIGGTGRGQARLVGSYVGSTKVVTVCGENWETNPNSTSVYVMVPYGTTCMSCAGTYAQSQLADRLLLLDTTIATLASQTSFTLTAGSADDDAYNNLTIVIEDASTATQKAVGLISNYVGASKTVTLKYDPAVFTMAVSDKVYILADNSLKSTVANRQFDVASDGSGHPTVHAIANQVWDELQSGHVDAGSFGKFLDVEVSTVAAAIGSGLLSCTWTQKDGSGNPMDNVQVWITTDEAGSNVVAGALYTDTAGEATFMLDAGTYYVWREKGGYNFSNPQTWTVS